MQKTKHLKSLIAVGMAVAAVLILTSSGKAGNDWITGQLSVSSPAVSNAKDFRAQIAANVLPTSAQPDDFTTGWLSAHLENDSGPSAFTQVGLLAKQDGLHWFAFTQHSSGMNCLQGTSEWVGKGCIGAVGHLVSLGTLHKVEMVTYGAGEWILRVGDANGNLLDVATVASSSQTIYLASLEFEEGYTEPPGDPYYKGSFFFYKPEYMSPSGFVDWPKSSPPVSDLNRVNYIWHHTNQGSSSFCPGEYLATPNIGSISEFWWAGSSQYAVGGEVCNWWLYPILAGAGTTIDNANTSLVFYNTNQGDAIDWGSWLIGSNWPRAYDTTLRYTTELGDKVTLSFQGQYITRVYTMAANRNWSEVYIDGVLQQPTLSDYATTTRWQVAKTYFTGSAYDHTIEVRKPFNPGYIDIDAFIVDTPFTTPGNTIDDASSPPLNFIGSWIQQSGWSSAYNDTLSWSNNDEDVVTLTFEGDAITYVYTRASNRGKAAITIDGPKLAKLSPGAR